MIRKVLCLGLISWVVGMLLAGAPAAGDVNRDAAKQSGAQALRDSARFPWYDQEADQVKSVEVPGYVAPPKSMDWEMNLNPRRPWSWGSFWRVVQYVVWILLAILFVGLLYQLLKSLGLASPRSHVAEHEERDRQRREAERIENLPFPVQRSKTDLLGEARRLYQTGNYQEAIIYLFSYQLVKLDENHLIRLAKGKTNRQYLGELRGKDRLRPLLSRTMLAFEDVFFGHYPLSKDRFERCWNQLDEFHQIVQTPATNH